MKKQVRLLKIVFDFLEHLSEEQLELLISKRARLKLDIGREVREEFTTEICIDEVCDEIEKFTTREEAKQYIEGLSLLKVDLKAIAKRYNIPLGSKDTNVQIIDKLVENVVGSKLKFDALLNTDLKR
ncbi:hypothetical protein C807_02391 [Lachnospiraceae bacterium 28-4]|nr:hypothetical protein C807_02391 [Lachnospiraceae bacterium 28-4]